MERLLELADITMYPAKLGYSSKQVGNINYAVVDPRDQGKFGTSLPIFTAPMESIVGMGTIEMWTGAGIRPIVPSSVGIKERIEACKFVFSAFSLEETEKYFLSVKQSGQVHLCLEHHYGNDPVMFDLASRLRKTYGDNVILMGGSLGNPESYMEYSKSGFDYVRVGIGTGSTVDSEKTGFYYPLGSLLIDVDRTKRHAGVALRDVKIIADGGISSQLDIMKAIALGADYVMLGEQFTHLVEAEGQILKKADKSGDFIPVSGEEIRKNGSSGIGSIIQGWKRAYYPLTSKYCQARRAGFPNEVEWIKRGGQPKPSDAKWTLVDVDKTLAEWCQEMQIVIQNCFLQTGSGNWKDFKTNSNICYGG